MKITIDIECRSDKDLTKCGVYAYADSPYFEITLFSYSVDDGKVQTVDLANGEKIPEEILNALVDENVIKQAFNVNFERVCLSTYLRKNYPKMFRKFCTENGFLNPVSWHCTMIHCRYLSLPSSLEESGKILHIEQQKMTEGKNLIKFFCVPFATENDIPQFHQPEDYPEKWTIFKSYNKRDVEAEMAIDRKLSRFPVPEFLWQEFYLDQEINDRGIEIDREFVEAALNLDSQAKAKLTAEMRKLTGVENPN